MPIVHQINVLLFVRIHHRGFTGIYNVFAVTTIYSTKANTTLRIAVIMMPLNLRYSHSCRSQLNMSSREQEPYADNLFNEKETNILSST
jgi:hypothetical protein